MLENRSKMDALNDNYQDKVNSNIGDNEKCDALTDCIAKMSTIFFGECHGPEFIFQMAIVQSLREYASNHGLDCGL